MTDSQARIRRGIFVFAALLLVLLLALKFLGIDQKLLKIMAAASGLLVALLLITYRAFAGVAESARNGTLPAPPPDDDEDEDDR